MDKTYYDFCIACKDGNLEIVRNGISKFTDFKDAFQIAISRNHFEIVKLLLPFVNIVDVNNNFYFACKNGDINTIKFLINRYGISSNETILFSEITIDGYETMCCMSEDIFETILRIDDPYILINMLNIYTMVISDFKLVDLPKLNDCQYNKFKKYIIILHKFKEITPIYSEIEKFLRKINS